MWRIGLISDTELAVTSLDTNTREPLCAPTSPQPRTTPGGAHTELRVPGVPP